MRNNHETDRRSPDPHPVTVAAWILVPFVSLLLALAQPGHAQARFTVNSTDDIDDGACDATHCSLREAIAAANSSAGTDTIAFDIAEPGVHTISPESPLPDVTDPLVIDGTSEPGFASTPVIELRGDGAGPGASGLHILAGNSTVRGLMFNRFATGIHLEAGGSNRIEGSYFGTDASLIKCLGNTDAAILIASSDNVVGGTTLAARNVIGCSGTHGVHVVAGSGNRIENNYIGVDPTGEQPLPNAGDGVRIEGSADNTVGGTGSAATNVIVGNAGAGVVIGGAGSTGNMVGRNTIHGNGGAGVALPDAGAGNAIRANSMLGNQGLGIDLGTQGVTANDPGDPDIGPNELQNHPLISGAYRNGAMEGSIDTGPEADYDVEIFTSDACDPTGHGEGDAFAGEGRVTTDVDGQASFSLSVAGGLTVDRYVTATATDAAGNTSEFSECARVQDFTLSALPDSVVVGQGNSANFAIDVAPLGASFDAGVQLTCSNLPPESRCSFSMPTVTPGADPARSIMTIATTEPSAASPNGIRASPLGGPDATSTAQDEDGTIGPPTAVRQRPRAHRIWTPLALVVLLASGFLLIGAPTARRTAGSWRRVRYRVALVCWLLGIGMFAGCGDDDPMTPLTGGTPPGRYVVTVSATSGPLGHTVGATIVVR